MNTPASKELFNLFLKYKARNFIFLEPGGNFGDLIIYKGAYKLADEANIVYETVTFDKFMNTYYPPDAII
jgi:hypothetical protein